MQELKLLNGRIVMKNIFKIMTILSFITFIAVAPAHADDTGKALMRGLLGTMLQGMEEQQRQNDLQQQQQYQPAPQPQQQYSLPSGPSYADRQQMKRIQTALKQLHYYDGSIDGIPGTGTTEAIKLFENDFECPVDGVLSDHEQDMLLKTTAAGFTSHEELMTAVPAGFLTKTEYDQAVAAGFSSKVEYERARTTGFSSKSDYDDAVLKGFSSYVGFSAAKKGGFDDGIEYQNALKSGFHDKAEYDAAQMSGYSTREEYVAAKVKEVRNLIDDMQAFLPGYQGDVDIAKISGTLKSLDPVTKGKWSDDLTAPAQELETYAHSLPGFDELRKQKDEDRRVAMEQRKTGLLTDIENIRRFSDQFLRKNLTDTRAIELAEGINKQPKASASMSEEELQGIHTAMQGLLTRNDLSGEYRAWQSPPVAVSNVTASESPSTSPLFDGPDDADPGEVVNAGMPRYKVPLETKKFKIAINSVERRTSISDGMFFNEQASPGSFYLIISYSVTNISKKPVSTWGFPTFNLRDTEDSKYSFDVGATTAYAAISNQTEKSFSDLNPGVTVSGAKAFQVSEQLFNPATWTIEVDADTDLRVPLQ